MENRDSLGIQPQWLLFSYELLLYKAASIWEIQNYMEKLIYHNYGLYTLVDKEYVLNYYLRSMPRCF